MLRANNIIIIKICDNVINSYQSALWAPSLSPITKLQSPESLGEAMTVEQDFKLI